MLVSLFVFELAGTVAALTLFGIADPDLFRTALWQVGSDNGFNSSPKQILYAYANYRPIPKTPFVWSQTCVDQKSCARASMEMREKLTKEPQVDVL